MRRRTRWSAALVTLLLVSGCGLKRLDDNPGAAAAPTGDDAPVPADFTALAIAAQRAHPAGDLAYNSALLDYLRAAADESPCGSENARAMNYVRAALQQTQALPHGLPMTRGRAHYLAGIVERDRSLCPEIKDTPQAGLALQRGIQHLQQAAKELAETDFSGTSSAYAFYNLSLAQEMGDDIPAAIESLRLALGLYREYGLYSDYADDYPRLGELLARQGGERPLDSAVKTHLDGVLPYEETLRFDWRPGARLELASQSSTHTWQNRRLKKEDGPAVTAQAQVLAQGEQLVLRSTTPGKRLPSEADYKKFDKTLAKAVASGPEPAFKELGTFLMNAALQAPEPDQVLNATDGAFVEIRGLDELLKSFQRMADRTTTATRTAFAARPWYSQLPEPKRKALGDSLETFQNVMGKLLDPAVVRSKAEDEWTYLLGAWAGKTLEHGAWSHTDMELLLPNLGSEPVPVSLSLRLNRRVPCTAQSTRKDCVELLLLLSTNDDPRLRSQFAQVVRGLMPADTPAGELTVSRVHNLTTVRLVTEANGLIPHELYKIESNAFDMQTPADPKNPRGTLVKQEMETDRYTWKTRGTPARAEGT